MSRDLDGATGRTGGLGWEDGAGGRFVGGLAFVDVGRSLEAGEAGAVEAFGSFSLILGAAVSSGRLPLPLLLLLPLEVELE
jgi:hypothetical protein